MKKCPLTLWIMLAVCSSGPLMARPGAMPSHVTVWDTMSPVGGAKDILDRSQWQVVPTDLLMLEKDPAAAASDPSHYGRAYAFQGDAAIENAELIVACLSREGRVVIHVKTDGTRQVELKPLTLKDKPAQITHCSVRQNTGDEAALALSFSAKGKADNLTTILSLGPTGILAIKPGEHMAGISLQSAMAYGVVPSFIGDDLVFDPSDYPALNTLYMPPENLFLGLLKGQDSILVTTWAPGDQKVTLSLDAESRAQGCIKSVDIEQDGKRLYLALLNAPGIWHREILKRSYLERDITLDWTRPFQAKWKTQLLESKAPTTFVFRAAKQKIWRGAVGSYTYPVWFDGDAAVYRLSKKIPPKGESIVYFTERQDTPLSVLAPLDVMKASLDGDQVDDILDVSGRQLRTHHRRDSKGIRRACTCGCTEAIEAVFKAGQEKARQRYVAEAVEDMVYFVTEHVKRIEEYQAFARDMIAFLERTGQSEGDLKPFVDPLLEITKTLQTDYNRAKANMKTLAHADQLARKTNALAQAKRPENLKACLELGKQWRAMGGAQDDVIAQSHRIVRTLFNEAGTQGVATPGTAKIASQIRDRCRQCLRNPDGYEIWPNY
ncbi:MAG: hypothetical protein GY809_23870 [Planctomycetes bacterium]|nr:hypothetical protein [Planctomycetota bacterium]